jgi:hypothetical protein
VNRGYLHSPHLSLLSSFPFNKWYYRLNICVPHSSSAGADMMVLVSSLKRPQRDLLTLPPCEDSKNKNICESQGMLSPHQIESTLIMDFLTPDLWVINFCVDKPPNLWCFCYSSHHIIKQKLTLTVVLDKNHQWHLASLSHPNLKCISSALSSEYIQNASVLSSLPANTISSLDYYII